MKGLKVLIIGHTWPEPKATAAGGRMMGLVHFFLAGGYSISFGSTAKKSDQAASLGKLGIDTINLQLNHHSFDAYLQHLCPDIVVFDRFITEEQFGWRVTEFAPNAIKILDTEDLHSLRLSRKQAFENVSDFTINAWIKNELTKREVASIYRCDLSLIISEFELQLLEEELKIPSTQLLYLPYMLEPIDEATINSWIPFNSRENLMFIGTGKHAPNIDAIKWLHSEIWPLIRKQLPQAELHIYGSYLPQAILELDQPENGFMVRGWIADAAIPMSRVRVNLVPLRYGAGIKGKFISAMCRGTPSVVTMIGAEGVSGHIQQTAISNNKAAEFAEKAIDIYTNSNQWQTVQQNGVDIINDQFDKTTFYKILSDRIAQLASDLDQQRTKNFIGAMLLHHTMAGSKYLAKWIASKNVHEAD